MSDKKNAYVSKMTSKTIPWMVYYYEDEKRKRRYFASRAEAEHFAAEINKELLLPTDFQISPNERYAFTNIKAKLDASGLSFDDLLKIIDRQVSERALEAIAPKMTKEAAIDRFIKSRIEKGLRNISIMGYEQRLPRYLKNYSLYMTQEDAQRLIDNAASPLHFKRTLSGFYAWLAEQNIVPENIFKSVKIPKTIADKKPASVLSVKDAYRLFSELPEKWQPLFALMAFAGIRPGEVCAEFKEVMKIGDIDFKHKKITVRAEVAKDRKFRILENLPENIWPWLEPLRQGHKDMKIMPNAYVSYKRLKDEKISVKLPKDILRHSFGSYGYHKLGAEHTIEIMGHITGFGVFAKHYKGLANKSDADAYFAITPESVALELSKSIKNAA